MAFETLLYEEEAGVAILTLNRPAVLNALNSTLAKELLQGLQTGEAESSVRALLITGSGRGFCAGADLRERRAMQVEGNMQFNSLRELYNPIILALRNMEKPVIAAVNGVAVGAGCSLALACDLTIASDQASFGQIFVKRGLIPDCGANWFLPRLVGIKKAVELMFSGETISAHEAERIGLINRVVPAAELMTVTRELAFQLAQGPTRAFGLAKKALNLGMASDLTTLLEFEAEAQTLARATADAHEGIKAFLEKRPPVFQGK